MARTVLIAAAALAAIGAAPAMAQECDGRVTELTGDMSAVLDNQAGGAAIAIREMRDAAVRLAEQDLDDACLATVEAIQAALDAYGSDPAPTRAVRPERLPADIEARATPLLEADLPTSQLSGADVYNYENDFLGEVEDVLVRGARPTHVVVTSGSFWNRGPGDVAIPASLLRWDPEWEAFFVPITSQAFGEAPRHEIVAGGWDFEENDRYYETLID